MTAVHSSLAKLLIAVGWETGKWVGNRVAIRLLGILSSGLLSKRIASPFPSQKEDRAGGRDQVCQGLG